MKHKYHDCEAVNTELEARRLTAHLRGIVEAGHSQDQAVLETRQINPNLIAVDWRTSTVRLRQRLSAAAGSFMIGYRIAMQDQQEGGQ